MAPHNVAFTELNINNMKRVLDLSNKINYQDSLGEQEIEYLELVKNKYIELINKA